MGPVFMAMACISGAFKAECVTVGHSNQKGQVLVQS